MNGHTKRLRDLFLLLLGTALFHNEFWIESEPRPIAVLVAGLLIGFVPALHADDSLSSGPLALILRALGLKVERVNPDRDAQEDQEDRAALEDRAAKGRVEDRAEPGAPGEPGGQDSSAGVRRSRPPSDPPESPS